MPPPRRGAGLLTAIRSFPSTLRAARKAGRPPGRSRARPAHLAVEASRPSTPPAPGGQPRWLPVAAVLVLVAAGGAAVPWMLGDDETEPPASPPARAMAPVPPAPLVPVPPTTPQPTSPSPTTPSATPSTSGEATPSRTAPARPAGASRRRRHAAASTADTPHHEGRPGGPAHHRTTQALPGGLHQRQPLHRLGRGARMDDPRRRDRPQRTR